jgi:hypothetical protein
MLCAVLSLVMLPSLLLGKANVVILPGLLLFVPIVTSIYRALQYGVWRHLGTLIILYFVFYIARALIIVQYAYDRIWQGFSAGNSSAGKS